MNIQPVRVLIASALASVAIFFWGFLYWTVIPHPSFTYKNLKQSQLDQFDKTLAGLDRGTYLNPRMRPYEGESTEESMERIESQAFYMISIVPKGVPPMPPVTFLQAFVHGFASAAILGVLLSMLRNSFCCYSHRLFFVFMIGLFATIWIDSGESIWWFRSCGVTVWHCIYHIGAWLLAGAVMAAIIKPANLETK